MKPHAVKAYCQHLNVNDNGRDKTGHFLTYMVYNLNSLLQYMLRKNCVPLKKGLHTVSSNMCNQQLSGGHTMGSPKESLAGGRRYVQAPPLSKDTTVLTFFLLASNLRSAVSFL